MKERYWSDTDDTGHKPVRPFAGMWVLICSVVCVLGSPIAVVVVVFCLPYEGDVVAFYVERSVRGAMCVPGFIFLIWAFVIGGKSTRWLCMAWAFWIFIAFVL